MASTGVPPTGRSRAFANRFSGFHRAKRLIGGSSLTGVSVATGVRRSRTRIDPCFRAARTHAPVRRCSSLIEISFMCHIVTHRWSHRQAMAHHSTNVLSQLFGRSTGEVFVSLGRCFGGIATKPPIGSIEAKIPAAAGGILPSQTSRHRAPHRESWLGCVVSRIRGRRNASFMVAVAAHFPAHRERADRVLTVSLQQTLRLQAFREKTPDRKAAALLHRKRSRWNCQFHLYLRSAVRWPRGRRRRFAKVARDYRTGLKLMISGPFFIGSLVGVGCRLMVLGPGLGTLAGTLEPTPMCAYQAHIVIP